MNPNADLDSHGGSPVIDVYHKHTHEGHGWHFSEYISSIGTSSSYGYRLTMAGTKEAHLVANGSVGADSTLELFEATTRPTGTAKTPRNRNRTKAAGAIFPPTQMSIHVATLSSGADGTLLQQEFIPGGSGIFGVFRPGGAGGLRYEWILKPGVSYLLKISNVTTTAAMGAGVALDWYEVE